MPSTSHLAELEVESTDVVATWSALEPVVARTPKKTRDHHLRSLYALADLRERAGEVPAARTLFRRIQVVAPDFADVSERLRSLR